MQLKVYKDYTSLSSHVASEILHLVAKKPDAVLCLATGDTPRLTYELMVRKAAGENVDFSGCTFIGLDEWVGVPPDNMGSCHYFLEQMIFDPLCIPKGQIHLFKALSADLEAECARMDATILKKGEIDFMLVGVGMNGHIGFNEPGVPIDKYSHVSQLDPLTQAVGQKYFKQETKLQRGLTLGIQHFLESRNVIMMASGVKKAPVIRSAIEEAISAEMPASIVRKHPNGQVMIDKAAASMLKPEGKVGFDIV